MAQDNDFMQQTRPQALRSWILGQMLSGAGYTALILVGILAFIYILVGIGALLPEDSKQAPDPMQRGSIEMRADPAVV